MFTLYSTFKPILLNIFSTNLKFETKQWRRQGHKRGQASADVAKHLGMSESIFSRKHVETRFSAEVRCPLMYALALSLLRIFP